jgi:hypothetical protein
MTEFLYIAIPAVTSLIGRGFIDSAIKETAVSTYKLLYKFVDHPEIDMALQKLDIRATMRGVKTIMNNIQLQNVNEPIYESLQLLHQVMCHISDDLSKLKHTASKYKHKWFRKWRTAEYKPYLLSLEINSKVLEKRLDNFYKLLEVSDKFPSIIDKHQQYNNTNNTNIEINSKDFDGSSALVIKQEINDEWDALVPLF